MNRAIARWDIFCTVVDNFGDIGVTWRLARQLTAEYGVAVRLWVDDLNSFCGINPTIDPARDAQHSHGVEVRRWQTPFPDLAPGDVVIEAFACELPPSVVAAMARQPRPPVWINLEYLSAEAWVEGCHGLPSPHPRLPLVKHFFFPGFSPQTGGLLMERGLPQARQDFLNDRQAQADFWGGLGLSLPEEGECRVFMFSYDNPGMDRLVQAWSAGPAPVTCLAAGTPALRRLSQGLGRMLAPGDTVRAGHLTVHALPFVPQEAFDRILWACDCNFVRGEDSLVRAQWAARPLVWHIYPQEDDAHLAKLDAFLEHYCRQFPANAATAVRGLHAAWNIPGDCADTGAAWHDFRAHLPDLTAGARQWTRHLYGLGDLAGNLVRFCKVL